MSQPDLNSVVAEVRQALASGDRRRIASSSMNLLVHVGSGESMTSTECKILSELLASPEAVQSDQSHTVYALVSYFWEQSTAEQQVELTALLEDLYPRVTDWIAQLAITDALADCPTDTLGFGALKRLRRIQGEIPRALVANGFGQLAKHSPSLATSSQALRELLEMREDPSARVRSEVQDVLAGVVATVREGSRHPLRGELIREGLFGEL